MPGILIGGGGGGGGSIDTTYFVKQVGPLSPSDGAANRASIQAAIDAVAPVAVTVASGATVLLPPGEWPITGTVAVKSGVTLSGAGPAGSYNAPTVLKRTSDVVLVSLDGTGPDMATQRFRGGGLASILLHGNDTASPIIQQTWGSALRFIDMAVVGCTGVTAVDLVDIQDSWFTRCRFDWCANMTSESAVVRIRNSGDTSGGARYSTNNSNEIRFHGCIWETYKGHAIHLQQGPGSSLPMNGIYIQGCKMETGIARFAPIRIENNVDEVWITDLYAYVDLDSGASAVNFLEDYAGAEVSRVRIHGPSGAILTFAQVWDDSKHRYQGVRFFTNPPTVGFVESKGTNSPTLRFTDIDAKGAALVATPDGGKPIVRDTDTSVEVAARFPMASSAETIPRGMVPASSVTPFASGRLLFMFFVALEDLLASKFIFHTSGTAAASITLARMGLYTAPNPDGTGMTCVAASANTTTLGNATFTMTTPAFATNVVGGQAMPTSYQLIRGQRYAIGTIFVGTTMPSVYGTQNVPGSVFQTPRICGSLAGQTDLVLSPGALTDTPAANVYMGVKA